MNHETVLFENKEKEKNLMVGILRRIADKIEHENWTLKQGTESLVIDFPDDMALHVTVKENQKREHKRSFVLE